ncbi:MAG: helix-turn-helix domain-containing protein [Oscillospiraceae bacterium]|nr:helix-turn-helix domain-containing protein [Oscillospiraceae bacterium]MBQ8377568.1 helix-turn-helix domain-containing protein [Oscillospiraceae bacterium]MBQ8884125.1 helix-turn-helix domain-containing protein [Oscillospiraceae bacterium]
MNSNLNLIEVGKRIKTRREQIGLTQEELGNLLWLNKSTIQRYETGKISKIKLPVLHAMAKQLNVNPDWLSAKTDNMGSFEEKYESYKDTASFIDSYDNLSPIHLKKFPMLGEIACGEPIWADEDKEHYVMAGMDIKADFCLTAKGDSMVNARINDGDIVFIRQQPIVENGEIAAVIIGNEATLKRWYFYKEESKLMLVAENPKYPPLVYMNEELETVRCLGKAVYFMSAL